MSNAETRPQELRCASGHAPETPEPSAVQVLTARDVPLGGPRAMNVRRTLPQRARSLVGAWCFADHYGPDDVAVSGGMDVAPHPHIGLQTVSWLFAGEIEHRDSSGVHAMVRPGEINLMTAGHGICHSEVSTSDTTVLHGVQLWVALPARDRDVPRGFEGHVPEPVTCGSATVRVFIGSLCGQTSPVRVYTPLLGAEIHLAPHATVSLDVDPTYEHGVLVDKGDITVQNTPVARADLGYVPVGEHHLTLTNDSDEESRLILLGGEPFGEEIVMWWNFVGGSHDDIKRAREDWMSGRRFGEVKGYDGEPLPAPELPNVPLKPRGGAR
ncbi:pirin family protein [Streptomyces sp. ODS28]|uniref:pirin family protein n=1 Tax=Streptomyces sp. ODS28 TaxID=3136688 RepID=UPI0031E4F89B